MTKIRDEFEYDLMRRGKANLIKRFWRKQIRKIVLFEKRQKVAFYGEQLKVLIEQKKVTPPDIMQARYLQRMQFCLKFVAGPRH
jgi:hypothetical protein